MTNKTIRPLPEYIQFKTPELALACTALLVEQFGWTRDRNMLAERGILENEEFRRGGCRLSFRNKLIVCWRSGLCQFDPTDGPLISSLADFADLITMPPIRVGEYEAKVTEKGVQVGCTFVPWETVDQIVAARPGVLAYKYIAQVRKEELTHATPQA